jgi:hypothetical protein
MVLPSRNVCKGNGSFVTASWWLNTGCRTHSLETLLSGFQYVCDSFQLILQLTSQVLWTKHTTTGKQTSQQGSLGSPTKICSFGLDMCVPVWGWVFFSCWPCSMTSLFHKCIQKRSHWGGSARTLLAVSIPAAADDRECYCWSYMSQAVLYSKHTFRKHESELDVMKDFLSLWNIVA